MYVYIYVCIYTYFLYINICTCIYLYKWGDSSALQVTAAKLGRTVMRWLQWVNSLKLQVSFAEYSLFYRALLQTRPLILRSLVIVATPYFVPMPLRSNRVTFAIHTHMYTPTHPHTYTDPIASHSHNSRVLTLQHTAPHCNALQHTATHKSHFTTSPYWEVANHCISSQLTSTQCNTL